MSNEINPMAFFQEPSVADLRLLACPGAEELTKLIDQHLVEWAKSAGVEKDSFIIPCECPRFQSGDAKGLVRESVRGDDIFIVIDPGNYSVTYNLFGYENHLSPDDHFANLKRLIQAVAGKAHRVSVIMPSLYGGRQHRRVVRESLAALGGAGALMAKSVQTLEVIAWPDLGCEAVRRLTVQDMPLTVILDAHGGDLYLEGPEAYRNR